MNPTQEQQAILDEIRNGQGNIRIDALAGCAKTTTLLEGLQGIPQRSILFTAFNRGIADEAQRRLPKLPRTHAVVVQTFHALGREIVKKHFPSISIDRSATDELISEACGVVYPGAPFEVRRSAAQLLKYAKEALQPTGREAWTSAVLIEAGFRHNLFSPRLHGQMVERTVAVVRHAVVAGLDVTRRPKLDFCDLMWLPAVLDLKPPSRYQAIMVDEVQDISWPQIDLLARVALPITRVIAAGDQWQQLYSWRGSLGATDAFKGLMEISSLAVKSFPLTMTFRCSRAVVREANQLVPSLRAAPDAEEGGLLRCTMGELPLRLGQGYYQEIQTFILSRRNAELLDCALFLWRAGIKFMLNAGQAILDPMFYLLDRELDLRDDASFRRSLIDWHGREAAKADAMGSTSRREQVDEQRQMLLAALRYARPPQIKRLLSEMLTDNKSGVLLSTVHKVKGQEADVVFLLRQTFARQAALKKTQAEAEAIRRDDSGIGDADEAANHCLSAALSGENIDQEELNVEYVGITRARVYVGWVDIETRDKPELLALDVDAIDDADLDAALDLAEREFQRANVAEEIIEQMSRRITALLQRTRRS